MSIMQNVFLRRSLQIFKIIVRKCIQVDYATDNGFSKVYSGNNASEEIITIG